MRHRDGRYNLSPVDATFPAMRQALVAVRATHASPFAGDDALYFRGYDADGAPARKRVML